MKEKTLKSYCGHLMHSHLAYHLQVRPLRKDCVRKQTKEDKDSPSYGMPSMPRITKIDSNSFQFRKETTKEDISGYKIRN